jgi:hypothetical protein
MNHVVNYFGKHRNPYRTSGIKYAIFSLILGMFALPVILELLISTEVYEVVKIMEKFLHLGGFQYIEP